MDSSTSMIVETTLIKLSGHNKTKRHECGKGTTREEEVWQGWEGDKEGRGMGVVECIIYMHEIVNEQILLIKA